MGWTSYEATHYKNGKVDRKAEMDKHYTQEEHDSFFNGKVIHYPKLEVLKSSMVGSIYYAAVHITNSQTGHEEICAVICLTSTKWNDGMNFGYKSMDESWNPGYYDCPKGILDLLSPTDNAYALEWRRLCHEKRTNKKPTLASLPVGTRIRYTDWNKKEVELYKHPAGYQFKRPFWMLVDSSGYISAKHIPESYEVISYGK